MLTLTFCLGSSVVFGDCAAERSSVSEALKKHDAVFSGKVLRVKGPEIITRDGRSEFASGMIEVTFRVLKTWKSVDTEEVTIVTPHSSCGYGFVIGEEYLVWASLDRSSPARLMVSLSSRTDKLARAAKDLRKLGKGHLIGKWNDWYSLPLLRLCPK
jgi:hypothetical protein